jgi:hypothetical protein
VELQATKKGYEEALWRATSPLTDLDDAEEIIRLKDRLEQQEGEISQLRRALADTNRQTHRGECRRLETCAIYVTPLFSSTNIFIKRDVAPLPTRGLQGVTRTQSGSFISSLSKRPTPEPSTPGPMDDPAFDDHMTHDWAEGGNIGMQTDHRGRSHTLTTPTITSVIPAVDLLNGDAQGSVFKVWLFSSSI